MILRVSAFGSRSDALLTRISLFWRIMAWISMM
jgi:hypothetical protein